VEDDGPGFAADPLEVAGVGLSATRQRLALRYGARSSIVCEARGADVRGARVKIVIPTDAVILSHSVILSEAKDLLPPPR
jgi:signal transduction histidine kinase